MIGRTKLVTASIVWTALVTVFVLFRPSYTSLDDVTRPLIAVQPEAVLLVLLPLVLTVVPLFSPRARIPVALALVLFMLLSIVTIGLWYVPSAVLLCLPAKKGDQDIRIA